MPIAPLAPLGGSTRVPPPATGSYAVPGGYYQGQASTGLLDPTAAYATNNTEGWSSSPIGSGVQAASGVGSPEGNLLASGQSSWGANPAGATNNVAMADYRTVSQDGVQVLGTPSMPAGSYQHYSEGLNQGRPQFRGMEVVDLTEANPGARVATSAPNSAPYMRIASPAGIPSTSHMPASEADFEAASSEPAASSTNQSTTNSSPDDLQWRRPFQ